MEEMKMKYKAKIIGLVMGLMLLASSVSVAAFQMSSANYKILSITEGGDKNDLKRFNLYL